MQTTFSSSKRSSTISISHIESERWTELLDNIFAKSHLETLNDVLIGFADNLPYMVGYSLYLNED